MVERWTAEQKRGSIPHRSQVFNKLIINMKDLIKKQEEETGKVVREINKELGYLTSLFMSQKIKGTDMIMPTEELNEASDRIGLYLFSLIAKVRKETVEKVCDRMIGRVLLDDSNLSWNDRIEEEEKIAKQILKELL